MNENGETLEDLLGGMDGALEETGSVMRAFRGELDRTARSVDETRGRIGDLDRALTGNLRRAFDDIVFEGTRASDALRGMAKRMSQSVLDQSLRPVEAAMGGAVQAGLGALRGLLPFADGGVMQGGRVRAFARGGVVDGPTLFPMRGGRTGLMGEAGPEAIMPLTRGPDGRLGVRSEGGAGGGVTVNVTISTPDAEGFRRSRGQIAGELARAVRAGMRNQ